LKQQSRKSLFTFFCLDAKKVTKKKIKALEKLAKNQRLHLHKNGLAGKGCCIDWRAGSDKIFVPCPLRFQDGATSGFLRQFFQGRPGVDSRNKRCMNIRAL
jgi:hypothetical protein